MPAFSELNSIKHHVMSAKTKHVVLIIFLLLLLVITLILIVYNLTQRDSARRNSTGFMVSEAIAPVAGEVGDAGGTVTVSYPAEYFALVGSIVSVTEKGFLLEVGQLQPGLDATLNIRSIILNDQTTIEMEGALKDATEYSAELEYYNEQVKNFEQEGKDTSVLQPPSLRHTVSIDESALKVGAYVGVVSSNNILNLEEIVASKIIVHSIENVSL